MKLKKIHKLFISIIIPFIASLIGSIANGNSIKTWYVELNKPFFNPPNWIFGPVWTILYLMIGISLYLVWTNNIKIKQKLKKRAYIFFSVQMFLNALWSILFFGLQMPLVAFIEIVLMWIAILLTIIYFHKISKTASYLLIPYLLWVTFASVLNFSLYYLN